MDDVSRTLSTEQLRRGAEGIAYRAEQLAYITMLPPFPRSQLALYAQALHNARIESALVHSRALAYFLTAKKHRDDDLHISHYSRSIWREESSKITESAEKIISAASSTLAHASIGAEDWEPHPGAWPLLEIATVLCHGLADFVAALAPRHRDRAALFDGRPESVREALVANYPGLTFTAISDHPLVGDLSRTLHTYIHRAG